MRNKIKNIKDKIIEYGFIGDYSLDHDSFTDLRFRYTVIVAESLSIQYILSNMTWTLELIDSSEQESYKIVGSNMTDEIIESTKHTSERYGMIYTFQAEETVRMIDEYLSRIDVKELFKQKLVHSFEIAVERIIPDILINGYMNHRFRITDSSMSKKEDKIFQKETDHYRDTRNEWEFKRLYRDVVRLSAPRCLTFLPEEKLLDEMGYSDLEDVLKDLEDSKLFNRKNQNIQKYLKYKLILEIRDDKIYLLSQSI